MLWLLLILTLVSACLLVWAHRGRRIDDHPLCRKCRFDLTGLPPTSDRCPECGRNIRAPHAVRVGHRAPNRPLTILATLLLIPSLVLAASLLALNFAHTSLIRYAPLFVLRWNLDSSTPATAAEALSEIRRRLDTGALSEPDLAPIIDAILARQAAPARPWDPALGDLVLDAATHTLITPARWQAFLSNSINVNISVSPLVHQGGNVTISASPGLSRTCTGRVGLFPDLNLILDSHFHGDSVHAGPMITGGFGGGTFGIHAAADTIMHDLPLGTYTAAVDYSASVSFPTVPLGTGTAHASVPVTFQVVPASTPFVKVNHDPAMVAAFAKGMTLRDTTISLGRHGGGGGLPVTFWISPVPLHAHFIIELVQDTNHWPFQGGFNRDPGGTGTTFDTIEIGPDQLTNPPHPGPAEILLTPVDLNPDQQLIDPFTHALITEIFGEPLHIPVTLTP